MIDELVNTKARVIESQRTEDIKVSVIMAMYNADSFVLDSVNSVLSQTHSNIELIICNDASTDRSMDILSNVSDPRIVVLQNEMNQGVSQTRNRCLGVVTGDYIAVLDADDIWESLKVEKQLKFLEENPRVGILGTQVTEIDSNGVETGTRDFPQAHKEIMDFRLWACPFLHSSIMVRSELMPLYNSSTKQAEDWELENLILEKSRGHNLALRLVRYRVHERNLTNSRSKEQRNESLKVVSHFPEIKSLSRSDFIIFSKIFSYRLDEIDNDIAAIRLMLKFCLRNGFGGESSKRLRWVISSAIRAKLGFD